MKYAAVSNNLMHAMAGFVKTNFQITISHENNTNLYVLRLSYLARMRHGDSP